MLTRRRFLITSGALILTTPTLVRASSSQYPFTLGVASGSPRETSVILWTRLAPTPLEGGGMPEGKVEVRYRVCSDPAMKQSVADGTASTTHHKAHAVHVKLNNLKPGREYWYQFYLGEDESPIGRTRTASSNDDTATFALAACQSYESGHYAAFADMAAWAPDCVIHVGDYIYESGPSPAGTRTRELNGKTFSFTNVRQHNSPEIVTLWDYRNRYALYRSDRFLQAAHAASPWLVAMDDHEVDNNWAGYMPQDPWAQTEMEFKVRRLAAFKAFYEHMPIEQPPVLQGLDSSLTMYGAYRFGPAQIHLLDTRQYRSDQVCGDGFPGEKVCEALQDSRRTMLGEQQARWLVKQLERSQAPFNVLAQQTWFAPYRYSDKPEQDQYNMDQWDGYPVERQRVLDTLAKVSRPVVLSGDWHCANAATLYKNPHDPRSKKIGHEFATTSISSHCSWAESVHAAKSLNPHTLYTDGNQRGYLRCTARRDNWKAEYRAVADASRADSKVSTVQEINTRDV